MRRRRGGGVSAWLLAALVALAAAAGRPEGGRSAGPRPPGGPAPQLLTRLARGSTLDSGAQIVSQVNGERSANGIPPVAFSASLSNGCRLLDAYEHLHGDGFAHSELPGAEGYSPAGDAIARSGPLLAIDGGTSVTGWGEDPFESGPNHLFGLLDPRLASMGADDSVFRETGQLVEEICVASSPGKAAPTRDVVYTYPGNGATIYPAEQASEEPEPPGVGVGIPAGTTTGPYLLVFADGPFAPSAASIVAASLSGPQGPVVVDVVDRHRSGGGFVIPTAPLENLSTYTARVSFDINGATLVHSWSFRTDADATRATGAVGSGTTVLSDAARQAIGFKITRYGNSAPVKFVFEISPYLPRPVVGWRLSFGDGLSNEGSGSPPHFAGHTYERAGRYRVTLVLIESGGARANAAASVTVPP